MPREPHILGFAMATYLTEDLGQQAAMELIDNMVHLKLVIRQPISGTRVRWKCDQKLKTLE